MTIKKSQKHAEILSIRVNSTSTTRALSFVRGRLRNFNKKQLRKSKFLIVTPNPEIVMGSQKDKELLRILNSANLALPDGIGLAAAHKFLSFWAPKWKMFRFPVLLLEGVLVGLAVILDNKWLTEDLIIIKGREFFLDLMKLANKKSWRIFLLGGEDEEAGKTAKNLRKSLKKVTIEYDPGPMIDQEAKVLSKKDRNIEKRVIKRINDFMPHILFVAFGSPKQEKWLDKRMGELEIGGAMVVGGTFNYMAKKTKLPPRWMDKLGLEWLWRLLNEPNRAKRIFTAFPLFPLKVFWYRLNN